MPMTASRAQSRGGKGVAAADTKEGDFLEHVFVASTHAYLLFLTDQGLVHWLKVYDVPQQGRTSRGRAITNMLTFASGEKITSVIPVREFEENAFLLMATRRGLVKKTSLDAYSRPMKGGIIAIRLEEGDNLIGVVLARPGDEIVLSTKKGKCIRFDESQARAMGRATYGVKGIRLAPDDEVVGMVVVDPEATLLTVCEHGYGKRTPFGTGGEPEEDEAESDVSESDVSESEAAAEGEGVAEQPAAEEAADESEQSAEGQPIERGNMRYRVQRRGGKGLIDIKTTARNGFVVATAAVKDQDEVMITTARGMLVRTRVSEISVIGRNTQGVRLIRLDEGDTVASLAKIAAQTNSE
jgi:DNA gyrase subunit A